MLESSAILEILNQLDNDNTYKKIFINGPWGIGKSYYVNKYIKEHNENFIYITLFGKTSFDSIENSVARELFKKLSSLNKKKIILHKFVKNVKASFSICGFTINSPELSRKGLISEYSTLLESKSLIIVIDDLERKSNNILIEDIMGMIEEFSQFNKVKIVIIGDENNMIDSDRKKWNRFKEKIIEKEYKIQKFSDESIRNLVTSEICSYIEEIEVTPFINDYIKKHDIRNLRTIIKGINLFKEVINNYVEIKENKKVNLLVLKNCMSVAIECTEEVYKPDEKRDDNDSFKYVIDEEINSRIMNHYFNSVFSNNDDTCILNYILDIYKCEYSADLKNKLNKTIDSYLEEKKPNEKDKFYLSIDKITFKINNLYKHMKNGKYKFITLDIFINDFYEILIWNSALELNLNLDEVASVFFDIMFKNYYDVNKSIYENKIKLFGFKFKESKILSDLAIEYNDKIKTKYLSDKLLNIEKTFKNLEYDCSLLEWLDSRFIDNDKEIVQEEFIKICRNNNYLVPDLSNEIDENTWSWFLEIWELFYKRMNEEYKVEFNLYVNSLKINKLVEYRINSLQQYEPLVNNK